MRAIHTYCFSLLLLLTGLSHANSTFLAADQAFQFSAESISKDTAKLNWKIEPHYYLYHDQFKITLNHQNVDFKIPKGILKDDPTFGRTEVHYNQVSTEIKVQPNSNYKVIWQGCSQDGLCYPLQNKIITTDADGLLPQNENYSAGQSFSFANKSSDSLLNASQDGLINTPIASNQKIEKSTHFAEGNIVQDIKQGVDDPQETSFGINSSLQWNDDQSFFKLLSNDSVWLNLIVFFGLGMLLAFLPCSLPLIPIISALIVQRRSGYRAVLIASSFVFSMAVVYGLMGIVVAELGFSFQRWFQSPWVISLFALMFVIFALNLFGLFQFALPQSWINRLNHYQEKQKAGTILGALSMGALSALIVGPCMSAPLAGALLFVSQSRDAFMGGLYLFILGLGIGFPLFIACVFGSKLLPKPGQWMNHLKVLFGFLMLGLAVNFIRPLFDSEIYHFALSLISFIAALYLSKILLTKNALYTQAFLVVLGSSILYFAYHHFSQATAFKQIEHAQSELLHWNKVSTAESFERAIANAKKTNKAIVIDVYADWCVACQPIESEVFPRKDVQSSLSNFYLIKLDLSEQNESQEMLMKKHEILGPPTLMIFDRQGHEVRGLRLTGTFKAETLIKNLMRSNELQD